MKKIILAISMLFIGYISLAQSAWIRVALDEKVSVMMPGAPQKNQTPQSVVFMLETTDSSIYNVNVIDFAGFGMDSAMLQGMVGEESFLEQFKTGFTHQQFVDAEVTESKMSNFGKYTVYEFTIEIAGEGAVKRRLHNYNLFVGSKDYSFTFSATSNEEALKDKFLKSIEVN